MPGFVQIIEFRTKRFAEGQQFVDEYLAATAGKGTGIRSVTCRDRDRPDTYFSIVEFPSYEEAMKNSELPETQALAAKLAELAEGPPTFYNLDVERVYER